MTRLMTRLSPILLVVFLVGTLGWMGYFAIHDRAPKRLADGLLSARSSDIQYRPCAAQAPADAFTLTLGDAALWFRQFPHDVVTVNGTPELTLNRNPDGTIGIDMAINVGDATLGELKGASLLSQGDQLRLTRPSGSELIVWTGDGAPLVQIDYVTDRSVRITGHLRFGGQDFIMGAENFMQAGKSIGNVCLGGDRKVDFAL